MLCFCYPSVRIATCADVKLVESQFFNREVNKMHEYSQDYADYQTNRSWVRKFIRSAYLRNIRKHVVGRAVDFGCGIGELLSTLPSGSTGLEINPYAVELCKQRNLEVTLVKLEPQLYQLLFLDCGRGRYDTLIISHVLEHLEGANMILGELIRACARLSIDRIIVVVPGSVGYASDPTHRQFIDLEYLKAVEQSVHLFSITHNGYFPVNLKVAGDYFAHNELVVIYDRAR